MQLHILEIAKKIASLHEGLCALHQAFSETSKVEMAHREQLQSLLAQATELHTALLDSASIDKLTEEEEKSGERQRSHLNRGRRRCRPPVAQTTF